MAETELLAPTDDPRRFISRRAWVREQGDLRVVFAYDHPLVQYTKEDRALERFASALLVEIDAAKVNEVAAAFKMHRVTVTRHRKLLAQGGLAALFDGKPGPKGPHTFGKAMRRQVVALRKDRETYEAIATHLGMSKGLVVAICAQAGLVAPAVETAELPGIAKSIAFAEVEPAPGPAAGATEAPARPPSAAPTLSVTTEETPPVPPPTSRLDAWVEARLGWSARASSPAPESATRAYCWPSRSCPHWDFSKGRARSMGG